MDNKIGRYKISIDLTNEEISSMLKQIANYMLQPFSILKPSLDVAFGPYRLSAMHPSFARNNDGKVITFSLRKITPTLKIKEDDFVFAPPEVHYFLKCLMESKLSVLISGKTGSGKTEFQKYLVSLMNKEDRIIMIEESYETHIKEIFKEMDITNWIVNNDKDELSYLIKIALRNNPDWLIIAETRGKEAFDMIQAVMTGHSAITTIHSESAKFSLNRLINMCKKSIDFDEKLMLNAISNHFKIGVHLERVYDNTMNIYNRRISEIIEYIPTDKGYVTNTLFEIVKDEKLKEKYVFKKISDHLKKEFIKNNIKVNTLKKFYGEVKKVAKKI